MLTRGAAQDHALGGTGRFGSGSRIIRNELNSPTSPARIGISRFDNASTLTLAFSSCLDPSTTCSTIEQGHDDPGVDLPNHETDCGDCDEHHVHRISQLGQRNHQDRWRLLPGDLVRTVSSQTRGCLGNGQSC
jgi:hypothetical protein